MKVGENKFQVSPIPLLELIDSSRFVPGRIQVESMASSCAPLVCDVGSGSIKIGYANGRTPKKIIPSIIGPPKHIGNDAIKNRNDIQCSFPIEGGVVRNWDEVEALFSHAIDEVKENDTNSASRILVTEPPLNPVQNKKQMAEMLFEKMDFER